MNFIKIEKHNLMSKLLYSQFPKKEKLIIKIK